MAIALAATGIAVANPTEAGSASASTTSTHDASYATSSQTQPTYTAQERRAREAKAHNPHGSAKVHRAGGKVRFHGTASDPDNHHARLVIALWRNGHKLGTVKTNKKTHHYTISTHLRAGKNSMTITARNIGRGTKPRAKLRHTVMHYSWAGAYSGYKRIAASMFAEFGWGQSQMQSLINLWNRESGWSTSAANASGAYGIPQALPGSKMSSAGPNWQSNPHTQIRWGLGYIADRYGSPDAAWGHSQSTGWY